MLNSWGSLYRLALDEGLYLIGFKKIADKNDFLSTLKSIECLWKELFKSIMKDTSRFERVAHQLNPSKNEKIISTN